VTIVIWKYVISTHIFWAEDLGRNSDVWGDAGASIYFDVQRVIYARLQFWLPHLIFSLLCWFLVYIWLITHWCGGVSRLNLWDSPSDFLVHDRGSLGQRLVQEALGKQDFGRLRLGALVVIDLRVSAHRGVATLILVNIWLLLLLRDKLRCGLLNFYHHILGEKAVCFIGLYIFIVIESVMVSPYWAIGSSGVLI
jgi:hypothetical protein